MRKILAGSVISYPKEIKFVMHRKLSNGYLLLVILVLPLFSFLSKNGDWAIVFIGDSITEAGALENAATQSPPTKAFEYLQSKSKQNVVGFSNQGHGGATTLDFLPGTGYYRKVQEATKAFSDKAKILFSLMLGTNDSAMEGTNGAPVSAENYIANLGRIIDSLHAAFPNSVFVLNKPLWYSPNTYNGAKYLQDGLDRISVYSHALDRLVDNYKKDRKDYVLIGDQNGYAYFKKNYKSDMRPQEGHQGVFYLHPNEKGSNKLGFLWGKAIMKCLDSY